MDTEIALRVNGTLHRLSVDPRTAVLDALREHLGLTGPKKGCDHGQCGACTILLDGRRANSCLMLAVAHQDAEIVTIEGLATDGAHLHLLISVELDQGSLVIRGERRREQQERQDRYYRVERSAGSFYRRLPVPDGVTADQIQAMFNDGILEVRMPRPPEEQAQRRTIPIA